MAQSILMRSWRLGRTASLVLGALACAAMATAQAPDCPPAQAAPPKLPELPAPAPRPSEGPNSLGAFIESASLNEAAIDVIVGQGRIITTKVDLAARGKPAALVAVGDPTVVEFAVVSSRQIRIIGERIGITDLVVTTPDNQTYHFEVRVTADLSLLHRQLKCQFPDACLKLSQVRDNVVVEGQARDTAQVGRILETIQAYLDSILAGELRKITSTQRVANPNRPETGPPPQPVNPPVPGAPGTPPAPVQPAVALPEQPQLSVQATVARPKIINMIRVPGPKQVLLRVRVAELNRTAFRQIGANILATPGSGAIIGTGIGGAGSAATANGVASALTGMAQLISAPITSGNGTTAFGIFQNADFAIMLQAMRRNSLVRILAEPNLVALDGQAASFLAGGEFPYPVPQNGVGGASTITIEFKKFGVQLAFLPNIQAGDVVRLAVDPEVSTLDFAIGTSIGGTQVPGLNTRRAHTVVEMHEGQTLAIAGLLQLTMDGTTNRIPGLGDLPVLGPFFSNTSGNRIEKELIVLVTPHLVDPMCPEQVPPSPGDEVGTPSDFEFYFHNRIEVPAACDWRATTEYDRRISLLRCMMRMDSKNVRGPSGYCD